MFMWQCWTADLCGNHCQYWNFRRPSWVSCWRCADAALVDKLAEADAIVHMRESHGWQLLMIESLYHTNFIGTYTLLGKRRLVNATFVSHHVSTDGLARTCHSWICQVMEKVHVRNLQRLKPSTIPARHSSWTWLSAWVHRLVSKRLAQLFKQYGHTSISKFIPHKSTNILSGIKPKLTVKGKNGRDWIHTMTILQVFGQF